jgi:hypothetical protein
VGAGCAGVGAARSAVAGGGWPWPRLPRPQTGRRDRGGRRNSRGMGSEQPAEFFPGFIGLEKLGRKKMLSEPALRFGSVLALFE